MKEQSARLSGGKKFLHAVTRTLYLMLGFLIASGAVWGIHSAGSEGDSLAMGCMVIGLMLGAWLKGYGK